MAYDPTGKARGIDVSHYDPVKDWGAVLAGPNPDEPTSMLGIKTSQGEGFVDPTFKQHQQGARANPFVLVAYYHFARSGSASGQARRFQKIVGPLAPNERLVLDLEVSPTNGNTIAAVAWVNEFYSTLMDGECGDRKHMFYGSDREWREICGDRPWDLATEVGLWAPRYNAFVAEPILPTPWAKVGWDFWQWTDGGEQGPVHVVPGVGSNGRCDANIFKGSVDDLRAYAAEVVAPASPAAPLVT